MRSAEWFGWVAGLAPLALAPWVAAAAPVAGLVISDTPTYGVTCTAGLCTSSALHAVLNVGELQAMLAQSDVTIIAGPRTADITVEAPFTWSATTRLTLDAYQSVRGNRPFTVPEGAGLAVVTNHGGKGGFFSFGPHGRADFASTASTLTVNGAPFILVNSVASLAAAVADNYNENYALANDYDASVDGVYSLSPVPTRFYGMFEGLGHVVRGVTIDSLTFTGPVGFFSHAGTLVENLGLPGIRVRAMKSPLVGGMAGQIDGTARGVWTSGKIAGKARGSASGGLTGNAVATVENCFSTATVQTTAQAASVGGLIGYSTGNTINSYATGAVSSGDNTFGAGGLIGDTLGATQNSYASGSVTSGSNSTVGGMLGLAGGSGPAAAYSTGAVSTTDQKGAGGFGGTGSGLANCVNCYWSVTTSHTMDGVAGGNLTPQVVPLTTQQLQATLPGGFSPEIWGQSPSINGGLPYLLALPPK